jgi:hypothetical protein
LKMTITNKCLYLPRMISTMSLKMLLKSVKKIHLNTMKSLKKLVMEVLLEFSWLKERKIVKCVL